METEQIWLDTTVDQEEFFDDREECLREEEECFKGEMENFINRYEKRYHTSVNSILLIAERKSFYGWNPYAGRVGYRLIQDLDEIFDVLSDDIKIYVDNDIIHVDYFDHDGADCSVVKLIPGTIEEKVYNDLGCYACELDYVEMLRKKNQLKPTKFWREK